MKKRKKTKRIRIRWIPLLGIIVFALFVGSSGVRLWNLHQQVYEEIEQLNEQKTVLLNQQQQLKEEIVRLNTPSYIEQLAREELGLVRPGEISIAPKKPN